MAAPAESAEGDKKEESTMSRSAATGLGCAAKNTRIKSFACTAGWGAKAMSECKKWLQQQKDDVKVQDISMTIKCSEQSKDTYYYWIYVKYTVNKEVGNGWNIDAYKTEMEMYRSYADWGKKAEAECNDWLEKCNDKIKVHNIVNIVQETAKVDWYNYFVVVVYPRT